MDDPLLVALSNRSVFGYETWKDAWEYMHGYSPAQRTLIWTSVVDLHDKVGANPLTTAKQLITILDIRR